MQYRSFGWCVSRPLARSCAEFAKPLELLQSTIVPAATSAAPLAPNPEELELDIACRGEWTNEATFVVDWQRVGDAQSYELTFIFEDGKMTFENRGSSMGLIDRAHGWID